MKPRLKETRIRSMKKTCRHIPELYQKGLFLAPDCTKLSSRLNIFQGVRGGGGGGGVGGACSQTSPSRAPLIFRKKHFWPVAPPCQCQTLNDDNLHLALTHCHVPITCLPNLPTYLPTLPTYLPAYLTYLPTYLLTLPTYLPYLSYLPIYLPTTGHKLTLLLSLFFRM